MNKNWLLDLEKLITSSSTTALIDKNNLGEVFPRDYRDDFTAPEAFEDCLKLDQLLRLGCLQTRLIDDQKSHQFAIKLYAMDKAVTLSQSMSILEAMGLEVLLEKPYCLKIDHHAVWIHHFILKRRHEMCAFDHDKIPRYFEELFSSVWNRQTENDSFNQLLFSCCLKSRNINILRAYTAYLHQITFPYSQTLIIETLNDHPLITLKLVKLFLYRFDPETDHTQKYNQTRTEYLEHLNEIDSLDQDLIFKQLLNLIEATVRTNYYQYIKTTCVYLSFKFDSRKIKNLPKPKPLFEIFVYSSRFEGIHLRGGKVARGGLRWSDRKEDYRTEVLGLMKAQMVKNAVIVPAGSKGGFITKQTVDLDRKQTFEEVKTCYQLYVLALLELTDNYTTGKIQPPPATRRHDQDDPYLVVAADKGTATFSDPANEVSNQQNFWLQDAFASGGSAGYDHKKMGITARGAWESVKRHFRGLGKDIQREPFRVLGIGDMSGDVFGNGMLLSPCIQLVAAFNHLHIFLDPNPDIASSYDERARLFALPRSSWSDYNQNLISKGGGIFSRKSKKIPLSPEIQKMTGSNREFVTPDQLIKLLLKSSVDLLWNGGIGTYIKSRTESHEHVKDKTNDAVRINGNELKAKVAGEGGNLGFTQLGRIEYAQSGGLNYTDSIDNSAGVDCSDHEVNLKIMFSRLVLKGEMSLQERNRILEEMTDDVAELCLQNNYDQTQIIDEILLRASTLMHEHDRFMRHLERNKILSRALEYLPNNEQIIERMTHGQGLTRPELSILLSYSKLTYKDALLESDLRHEPYFDEILLDYFPATVRTRFADEILSHPLKQEIIATQISNQVINQIGPGFGFRMREETGANIASIAKAYVICKQVFETDKLWQALQDLDNQVNEQHRYACFRMISGLLERTISWLLRNHPGQLELKILVERYKSDSKRLRKVIPHALTGQARRTYTSTRRQLLKQGFSDHIASELSANVIMASAFDIIETKIAQRSNLENTARLFFAIAERLQLNWIREQISETEVRNHWHQLAIANMRNALHRYQRELTELILQSVKNKRHTTKALTQWMKDYDYAMGRYDQILTELQAIRKLDFTMASVAVSEVRRLLTLSS
ncbi:MAG: NAD-glutamate dehydrogenase [Gammaproteobacteria bacterium]|nr:NAD-glutamate dehydrogenase [Gammaproteobacteria bacterium]